MKSLIISTCKYRLSEEEFVLPIYEIAKKFGEVKISRYFESKITESDRILISGTALKDFDYQNYIKNFEWIKRTKVPVLGICAGYQIILKIFEENLQKRKIIGVKKFQDKKLYFLSSLIGTDLKNFQKLWSLGENAILVKHNNLPVFATAFHPEVFNKELIENFIQKGKPL